MIDIVFPKDNEKEFISIAEKLGLAGLLFVYDKKKDISHLQKETKLKLFATTAKKVVKNTGDARNLLEKSKNILIYNLEDQEKDFTKIRNSGLNEVHCELARKNNILVGFSLSSILNSKRKSIVMGRMMQNIMLCRKKKVRMIMASFANDPWKMRAESELQGLAKEMGLVSDYLLDDLTMNNYI